MRRKKQIHEYKIIKKSRIRKAAALATALAMIFSFTACGDSEDADSSSGYEITVGDSSGTAISNPLIQLAEEKGYFEDYDLTINHQQLENAGSVMYDALSVGKIEAAYAQVVPPVSYGAQGYDVTLIAGTVSGGMVAVCLPENYDELSDISNWVGHSIGVIQMSTSELTVRNALKEYGIDGDDDVTFTMIDDYSSIALSTAKGNVDIGFVGSEYVETAEDAGCVVLTTLYDIKKDYVCCRQSAYSEDLSENRQAYVYYLAGEIKAYKDINTDPEDTAASLVEDSGQTEDYIYAYIYDTDSNAHRTYNPDPNYNGVQDIYEIMLEQGYVESELTLDEFFDISVYADALKLVIEENPDDSFYQDMKDYFAENNNEYPDFDTLYGDEFWEE